MTPLLIGLHGRRGAGKDTAFGYIREWAAERGVRAGRRGFADDVKWSFARLFMPDCSRDEGVQLCERFKYDGTLILRHESETVDGPYAGQVDRLEHEITGRMALQRYGTEAHREVFTDNFWVDNLLPRDFNVTVTKSGGDEIPPTPTWPWSFISTTDYMIPNEAAPPEICVITDLRFENEAKRILELGGETWYINRPWEEARDQHASEVNLSPGYISHEIPNRFGLDELRNNVFAAMTACHGDRFRFPMEDQIDDPNSVH
jgi:hypothetical protein